MISDVKLLIIGTFSRVRESEVSIVLWSLCLLVASLIPAIWSIIDAIPKNVWFLTPFNYFIPAAVILLMFFVYWELTRAFADYEDKRGEFLYWLGWSIVSGIPVLLLTNGVFYTQIGDDYMYGETIAYTFLAPVTAPLLVHASGRAIDADGPDIGEILAYWKPRYMVLFTAYFLVTSPFNFISEILYNITDDLNLLIDIPASLISITGNILGIVLTVDAFHKVPQKDSG